MGVLFFIWRSYDFMAMNTLTASRSQNNAYRIWQHTRGILASEKKRYFGDNVLTKYKYIFAGNSTLRNTGRTHAWIQTKLSADAMLKSTYHIGICANTPIQGHFQLGPVGPSWSSCWPHGPCYQGCIQNQQNVVYLCIWIAYIRVLLV